MSVSQFDDAIPSRPCRQTYFRNSLMMEAGLRALELARGGRLPPSMKVLDAGAGPIEPLLLGAMIRAWWPEVDRGTIEVIDPDAEVIALLEKIALDRSAPPLYDAAARRLSLDALAPLFAAPEAPSNPLLATQSGLERSLAELDRLGLLATLGLGANAADAAAALASGGLVIPREWVTGLRARQCSILDLRPKTGRYDLIVANFSIQYPISEGHADAVAAIVEASLSDDGVFAHAATYGAQARLARALAARGKWHVVFGVRELDQVKYLEDAGEARLRLRIRTDAIYHRGDEDLARAIGSAIFPDDDWAKESAEDDTIGIVDRMDASDGLSRPRLATRIALAGAGRYRCAWGDREVLLQTPPPLPSRIEWRARTLST